VNLPHHVKPDSLGPIAEALGSLALFTSEVMPHLIKL